MPLRFTVLGSGSSGNAAFLEADHYGILIDGGLGPRQISHRLKAIGASWAQVCAVLLTHTHTDHWRDRTLAYLRRLRIPLYCHPGHHPTLQGLSEAFVALQADGLVLGYREEREFILGDTMRCWPLELRHDGGPTFGFRLEGIDDSWAVAYLADLGCWSPALARAVSNVDILALEFNHDVALEYNSGRSPRLIGRVLGDAGHLSNAQAAAMLREVLRQSEPGRLRHVVQLHLSRDCNRPELAVDAARACLNGQGASVKVHVAHHTIPGPHLSLDAVAIPADSRADVFDVVEVASPVQRWLFDWSATDDY